MHYLSEHNIFIFLVQVFILLGLARAFGELFTKWKQPTITAEILVGVVVGPTVFGRLLPGLYGTIFPQDAVQQNMLETVAWIGILLFLLKTGLEMDFSSAWRQRGDALKIALLDIAIPMTLGFLLCLVLPEKYFIAADRRLIFSLFVATVMTISALPVSARVLNDLNLYKTDLGFLIMSALSVNDIIGWLIFTMIIGFFTQADLRFFEVGGVLLSTVGFAFVCLAWGRNFTNFVISKIKEMKLPEQGASLTFICLLGMLCGAITMKIGIHALFGFFLAGIMAGEAKALSEKTRNVISQMVLALFVPLFFVNIGLKMDFLANFDPLLVLFITAVGIGAKFLGVWFAVPYTEQAKEDRLLLAIAHTPGGEMQIVVSMLALEFRIITEPVFEAIVFSAVFSTVILGPWMKYALRKRKAISILEYFIRDAAIPRLISADRNGAMQEMAAALASSANMPHEEDIFHAALKREEQMGTAMEEGIAVPHARMPSLLRPVVAFARSEAGIEWNSPDGKPAQLIFMILTPPDENDAQLQILRSIAQAMSDKDTREAILKAGARDEIWGILQRVFGPQKVLKA